MLGVEVPCSAVSSHLYMPSYARMQCYSPSSFSCVPTPVHAVIQMCEVLPTPSNPNSCSYVPTPVHAVVQMCAVLPTPSNPPTPAAVSPHLYMLSYTCVQCYPPSLQFLQLCPHTCTCCHTHKCSVTFHSHPCQPAIVHALIHTGAVLLSIPPTHTVVFLREVD